MQPTFQAMSALGWSVIPVPHGHNLQEVYQAVEKAVAQAKANPNAPVCLWIKTIKGYGVKSTEENAAGGHGFPLPNGEKIIEFVNEIYGG
jgi:transketolase